MQSLPTDIQFIGLLSSVGPGDSGSYLRTNTQHRPGVYTPETHRRHYKRDKSDQGEKPSPVHASTKCAFGFWGHYSFPIVAAVACTRTMHANTADRDDSIVSEQHNPTRAMPVSWHGHASSHSHGATAMPDGRTAR